jgi:hypothetical protein
MQDHETFTANTMRAAEAYEALLAQGNAPLDAYLNLAVLYWQCAEPGFLASTNLDLEVVKRAADRYGEVLDEARRRFPENPEVQFWKLYFDQITLGEPPFEEQCKRLVEQSTCSLVPYFYLFSASQGQLYQEQAAKLLDICRAMPTLKNRYIISVIEGVRGRLSVS